MKVHCGICNHQPRSNSKGIHREVQPEAWLTLWEEKLSEKLCQGILFINAERSQKGAFDQEFPINGKYDCGSIF
ncbi:hypothetical protein J2X69_001147 [Algoriphagus sp. 4150]|uniref:hypothetical protein n=1 Tax=Algoriphagus sp. 4150 TaxID=2817756 RepID=UPI002855B7D5|nr:hypothetical protein [Algoriphagus sp. 4150]MDR7128815.1 hypothetical protein [Algoriphagus sp. 4150]